ncbi:MAG: CubicO group peptidase (beta-lactamase class C family), partial [Cyclobacteriaceae bacterium]
NHFVWIEAQEVNALSDLPIGGVYYKTAPIEFNRHPTWAVALQLSEKIVTTSDLPEPDFNTLNSISDKQLIEQYLILARQKVRKQGIDHLVLPEVNSKNQHLTTLFEQCYAFDSSLFVKFKTLNFELTDKKKKLYEQAFSQDHIQIIPAKALNSYKKILTKGPRKPEYDALKIMDHLLYLAGTPSEFIAKKSDLHRFYRQLSKSSIVPLQRDKEALPIKRDTIAIWSERSSEAALPSALQPYYATVLNGLYDKIPAGIPLVIDARTDIYGAMDYALSYQRTNPIIWIAEQDALLDVGASAVLVINEITLKADDLLAEILFGSEPAIGKLNQPVPAYLVRYSNEKVVRQQLLGIAKPESLGMDPLMLDSIDLLAEEMIRNFASPGAQLLVAKEGKIVLDKNYGYLTYDSLIEVEPHTLYDVASLTKVTATLLALMKLDAEAKINLDSTLGYYLPEYLETNKSSITLRQLLAHQGGLKSYIPFWKRSLKGDFIEVFYYKNKEDESSDKRSFGYEPDPVMLDSLISWVRTSPVDKDDEPGYKYSDIGFMILHQVVESVTQMPMDRYLKVNFYDPLGMFSTTFNPLKYGHERYHIAPTEFDYYFRDEQVWGQVHDRNAAVFGGIAGHAGLFSNARDLAKLLQMILQSGTYGNQQLLEPETIDRYNHQYFSKNRRGLGWDKPGEYNPNISSMASLNSFGHTGFTGTMVWVDPDSELIFIFLSNRIFPDANNMNLIKLDTRKRMHDLVYQSIGSQ